MHTHISALTRTHTLLYGPAHTYQAARLIVVKLHQHTDVSTSPLVLRIHKEPRLLVPEVHVIATASPLPGGTAILGSCEARGPRGAWQAQGPWRGLPAGCLAAALQQLAHGAGLRDRVAGACSSNSKHEGSLPDVCGGREGRSAGKAESWRRGAGRAWATGSGQGTQRFMEEMGLRQPPQTSTLSLGTPGPLSTLTLLQDAPKGLAVAGAVPAAESELELALSNPQPGTPCQLSHHFWLCLAQLSLPPCQPPCLPADAGRVHDQGAAHCPGKQNTAGQGHNSKGWG